MIHVRALELRRVRMPLVAPFRTSFGTETVRDVLLVRALADEGEGWGECVAPAEPLYSAEYVEGAQAVTGRHLAPPLLSEPEVTAAVVAQRLAAVTGHPMAKAAVEMAILDAELRAAGMPLGDYLGAVRPAVEVGVSVGISDDPGALLETVAKHVADGYRRIKLKIEPGRDIDAVAAVREAHPGLPLQVDANAAYRPGDIPHLAQLDAFGLVLVEQPFPADDLRAHAALARRLTTPVCLDESITSARAAADAIAAGACTIVNVKAGRVGGYLEARRVHDVCAAHGIPVWCGGMLETGLGRAANLALAGLPNFTLPGDISASSRYYTEDLTEPFVHHGGLMSIPRGPGLGVTPRAEALSAWTTAVEQVSV